MSNKCYLGIKRYIGESFFIYANGKEVEIKVNDKQGKQVEFLVIAERDVIIARSKEMLENMKEKYLIAHV